MLGMIGWDDPAGSAEKVVAFETKLAEDHWSRQQNRDVDKTYNPMTIEQLVELAPGFDWRAFLDATGLGAAGQAIVAQNTAVPRDRCRRSPTHQFPRSRHGRHIPSPTPRGTGWQSQRFVDANFAFHGQIHDRRSAAARPREAGGQLCGKRDG